MRNPFRRKALTAAPEVSSAIQGGWNPYPLLGAEARQRVQTAFNTAQGASYGWLYARSPAVRTVIDALVRNIGQLELRLYEEKSESERQPKPDHPAALSMRYPNEQTTADAFVRQLFKDFLLYDQAFALMNPAGTSQVSFAWIPAYMVEVQSENLFGVDNYRVWPGGTWNMQGTWVSSGRYRDFPPENVLHWHGENPLDPRVGCSRLDTLRDLIAEDVAIATAITELAKAGLSEQVWVSRPETAPELSPEASNALEEDLANRLKRRTTKPVVLEEGMRLESFGISPRDAQMLEVRRWLVDRVAAVYGAPPGTVYTAENLRDAQSIFYSDVLPPYCEDFTKFLNLRLLVRVWNWTDGVWEFNLDEKLMGDQRLTAFVSATGRAVMTSNEARAKLNLPKVKDGDELVTPLNVMVGDKPSPQAMPPQRLGGPGQDGAFRRSDQQVTASEGGPGQPAAAGQQPTAPPSGKSAEHKADPKPQFHPRRAADKRRQDEHVNSVEQAVSRHFNRLNKAVAPPKAKSNSRRTAKKANPIDWKKLETALLHDLVAVLRKIAGVEGSNYSLRFGGGAFDQKSAEPYLKAMAEGYASGLSDTIRQEVSDLGPEEALARQAAHVHASGGIGVRATTFARHEAAKQSPGYDTRQKTWIADTDRHAEWDGVSVPIDGEYPGGISPGSEIFCKCTEAIT